MAKDLTKKRFFKKQKTDSGKTREKLGKKENFPSNNRSITEPFLTLEQKSFNVNKTNLNKKTIFFILISFLALFLAIFASFNLYKNIQQKQKIQEERQKITTEIKYWQKIIDQYQEYRDGYFRLAMLEYRLNDFKQSKVYLEKVLEIDPSFEPGRKLEVILSRL